MFIPNKRKVTTMGSYVNPKTESKESFLTRKGVEMTIEEIKKFDFTDNTIFPVILINNGIFTAAGVAFNKGELNEFTRPADPRPRKCYLVELEDLKEVSDIMNYIKR